MRPRSIRHARQAARGQVMLLFALMSVLLLVIAGLAVDAGMSYLSSDQVERAAAAAALAGVAYLPGDTTDAWNTAYVEAARNGFASDCSQPGQTCVTVSQPTTNELKVSVTVQVPVTFLSLLGFGSHPVTESATAEYLPPVSLGQPGTLQGTTLGTDGATTCNGVPPNGYCSTLTSGLGSGGSNFYFERTEGWGNPRSEGDAFTPTPKDEAPTSCGPNGASCDASSLPDKLEISPIAQTEQYYPTESGDSNLALNYTGGSSYLVTVPPQQTADVQIYNPSFAPDSNDQTAGDYTYHEDDSSFANGSTTDTDYSAMSYTLFQEPTLSSQLADIPVSQEIFYPFNATGLTGQTPPAQSYYYWPPTAGVGTPSDCTTHVSTTQTPVSGWTPSVYHEWISATHYAPTNQNDINLFCDSFPATSYLHNPNPAGGANMYWRLEVDTLQWNGAPTCTTSTCQTTAPQTGTSGTTQSNGQSKAHKGYAVQVVHAPSSTCTNCAISAMGDMTVYTPISSGSSAASFSIPLFQLDPSYAGQTIDVDLFDIGDVSFTGSGSKQAYVGIQQPDGTWATATLTALGNTIGTNAGGNVNSAWGTGACPNGLATACFETSASNGSAVYNGQWVQLRISVPGSLNTTSTSPTCNGLSQAACWSQYWNLEYYVDPNATAGDTFSVQVGFNGSPDRLLP